MVYTLPQFRSWFFGSESETTCEHRSVWVFNGHGFASATVQMLNYVNREQF
ncbi:MAG: hypothetical protein JOZ22_09340 [Acidobacteriia bacterium]|nr:hypothetical protein [Terriglobia bacterium]